MAYHIIIGAHSILSQVFLEKWGEKVSLFSIMNAYGVPADFIYSC